jgi:hypothetical protein
MAEERSDSALKSQKTKSEQGKAQKARAQTSSRLLSVSVLVLQNGFRQASFECTANTLLAKKIDFGRTTKCALHLPFASLPDVVKLLSVSKRKITLLLDPRFVGTVNDGNRVGSVGEFLSPRGSLMPMGSVLEPLRVKLSKNSRVSLLFGGYEILIKVQEARPAPIGQAAKGENARGGLLNLPTWNDPIERWVPTISLFFGSAILVPLMVWLLKAPLEDSRGMLDLPFPYAREFVHPKHYEVLPFVFRGEMDNAELSHLALDWVNELQKRWLLSGDDHSEVYRSRIQVLGDFPIPNLEKPKIEDLERAARQAFVEENHKRALAQQKSASPDQTPRENLVAALQTFPHLFTQVSGNELGSFYVRMVNRIAMMDRMFESIRSQEESEQEILQEIFMAAKVKYEPFGVPVMETIVGTRPDEEFRKDMERRELATLYGEDAKRTKLRAKMLRWAKVEAESSRKGKSSGVVWLQTGGLMSPHFLRTRLSLEPAPVDRLIRNARLSAAWDVPPPPPPPVPKINLLDVDLLVFAKREELRACYEAVLRRNDTLQGTVRWELRVALNGKLENARIAKTEIGDREFLLCLQERLKSWRFPRPQNGAITFEYPFRFKKSQKIENP